MMTWNEYVAAGAHLELTKNDTRDRRFTHGLLGFLSEIGELEEACDACNKSGIKEELGDQCFYIAILCRLTLHEPTLEFEGGVRQSDAANLAKRWLIAGKEPSEAAINALINTLYKIVYGAAQHYGLDMSDICESNLTKLNTRSAGGTKTYAETLEESNRDRAAEAKIMEGK